MGKKGKKKRRPRFIDFPAFLFGWLLVIFVTKFFSSAFV